MKKKIAFLLKLILMIIFVVESTCVFADSDEITLSCKSAVAPFAIFEQSEGVRFEVNVEQGTYSLIDYYGNNLIDERFSNNEIVITGLSLGRYTISVTNGEISTTIGFSVVPDIDKRRDSSQNGFGLSAMNSHLYSSEDREEAYAKTIALAGVPYVREFCLASEVSDPKKECHFRYKKLLEEYHKLGIDVMFMFEDLPGKDAETGVGLEDGHFMTRDLTKVYRVVKDIYEQRGECFDVLEIENEVDVWTGDCDGPDLYAAFVKTASIAAADCSSDLLVSTGGFTDQPHDYVKKFLSNGVADFFDIYNVHHYKFEDNTKNIVEYPTELSEYFPLSEEYGLTEKMLWAGEYGLRFPYEDDTYELTDAQQKQQARSIVTSFIETQAAGVDKAFWFTHGYMKEFGYDTYNGFGTMDRKHSPNMSYSSVSAMTNALGNAKYKGKIKADSTNIKAHCYADGKTEIVCVWAEDYEDITLSVNEGIVTLTDIMGNEQEIEATNGFVTISAGPDIQYIRAENGFLADSVVESIKYSKSYKKSKLTKAQRIVMLPMFSTDAESEARTKGYKLSSTENNEVKLRVYNFNNEEMSGTITAKAPDGWNISSSQQTVTILPMEYAELSFSVTKDGWSNLTGCLPLIFEGDFDGEMTSPAVSYIRTSLTFDYTYNSNLSVNSMVYDGEILSAELNGSASDVKFFINGRTYDAELTDQTAELKIILPNGINEVYTIMFDLSGTAATSINSVTVSREGAYTVIYDANGGGAAPMTQLGTQGEAIKLSSDIPYKYDSIFMGWTTKKFGEIPEFNQGDEVEFDGDVILYAVWKDGVDVERGDSALYNAKKAIIRGKADITYADKKVNFVVFDQASSPENLSASDIVNIGETRIDLDGNYQIEFKVGDLSGYRYILNVNGEIIDSYMTETTLIYDWMEKEIVYTQKDDSVEVIAKFDNYGETEAPVALIVAFYGSNDELLDVHLANEMVQKGVSGVGGRYNIPAGTIVKKVFLWSDDEKLTPLKDSLIYN